MFGYANLQGRIRDLGWKVQRALCDAFYYDLDENLKIKLYYESALSYLIYHSEFERAEQQFVRTFLKEGDIFVDVGANVGLFSLIASRTVAPKGRVYAFEPAGKMFNRLTENIALNNIVNIVALRMALSNAAETGILKVSLDGYDGWNSFSGSLPGESVVEESVQLTTLDWFCQEYDLIDHLTMVKIDVEGWENQVLQGADKTLSSERAPLLMIEFAEECARNAGTSCQELYRQIIGYGYILYRYDVAGSRLIQKNQDKTILILISFASKVSRQDNESVKQ